MVAELERLTEWVGRTEVVEDVVAPFPAKALAATLDIDDLPLEAGSPLPPGWHWLYTLSAPAEATLGEDGHARRGNFLPPVPLPRRMYAGGRMSFMAPLTVGAGIRRESQVLSVSPKQGRSGTLVFVTVRHRISGDGGLLVEEEQDLVYREVTSYAPATSSPAEQTPDWERTVIPDPVLLFRFSALTFNSHRIHYDRPYVTEVEGYPGLLVHGPLLAMLLLDLARRSLPDRRPASFLFRAQAPLFDTAPFSVAGRLAPEGAALWAAGPDGGVNMTAAMTFRK